MTPKQKEKRRYNLHYRARLQNVKINTKQRTIFVQIFENLNKYARQLHQQYGYLVQLQLPF